MEGNDPIHSMLQKTILLLLLALTPALALTPPSASATVSNLLEQPHLTLSDLALLDNQDLRELGLTLPQRLSIKKLFATAQDFTFVVSHFNSSRQWGKCLNIIVTYRYFPTASSNSTGGGFLDYRRMRDYATTLAQPTEQFPLQVQWEVVNNELVRQIMNKYSTQIISVSSQIQVLTESNIHIQEPGNHGSIVTKGAMPPLSQNWINAFRYDCTKTNGTIF